MTRFRVYSDYDADNKEAAEKLFLEDYNENGLKIFQIEEIEPEEEDEPDEPGLDRIDSTGGTEDAS